jgi:hypothetical protein
MKEKKQSVSKLETRTRIAPKNDREKALQALEFAKSIQGKSVFLPKGQSRDFENMKKNIESQKKTTENILSASAIKNGNKS